MAQKLIAIALLPLLTHHLTRAAYGEAEVMLQLVFALVLFVRFGIIEALFRFYFIHEEAEQRTAVLRNVSGFLIVSTSVAAGGLALAAAPISRLLLGMRAVDIVLIAAFGLWVQSVAEMLQSFFRVDGRALGFLASALANILLTAALTIWLVVVEHDGAQGLLLGNFLGTTAVALSLAYVHRDRARPALRRSVLGPMLRFGAPSMSADVTLYVIQVMDRVAVVRFVGLAEAGLYSLAIKLSQGVIFLNQAFHLAWAPLAYSIRDDGEARRFYARAFTYFLLISATMVLLTSLAAPWIVRLLAAPAFYRAHEAVPLISLAVMLYALYMTMIVAVGRVHQMHAAFVAALSGTLANAALLVILVPEHGMIGAALALIGADLVILPVLYAFVRRLFPIPFEWRRIVTILVLAGGIYALGVTSTAESGTVSLLTRAALVPAFLLALFPSRFFHSGELAQLLGLVARARSLSPTRASLPATGGDAAS